MEKNVIDLLGDNFCLPNSIPPFADPSANGCKIIHGVSYASATSGIIYDTGLQLVMFDLLLLFYYGKRFIFAPNIFTEAFISPYCFFG